jgi:hypothetical protein
MLCGFRRFPKEAQPTLSAPYQVIRQGTTNGLKSQRLGSLSSHSQQETVRTVSGDTSHQGVS